MTPTTLGPLIKFHTPSALYNICCTVTNANLQKSWFYPLAPLLETLNVIIQWTFTRYLLFEKHWHGSQNLHPFNIFLSAYCMHCPLPDIGATMMYNPWPCTENLDRNRRQPDNDSGWSLTGTCDKMANDFFFVFLKVLWEAGTGTNTCAPRSLWYYYSLWPKGRNNLLTDTWINKMWSIYNEMSFKEMKFWHITTWMKPQTIKLSGIN